MIGAVHCDLRFGPVGPLKNAGWSSPQRPSNTIQGKAAAAAAGSLGIVFTAGRSSTMGSARVVAADARLGRASDVQGLRELVRVRAGGGVDDRMRLVDELELVLAPVGALGALVRAVPDRDGSRRERRGRIRRRRSQLDHLPVALVQVVELVEDVEEPVLERDLAGVAGVGHDVRVDRGLGVGADAAHPALVVALRLERIPREVEVVLEAVREVGGARPDLDEVRRGPRAPESDGRLVEHDVDVDRPVLLAVLALPRLLDEADDRRVALGERGLVREVGGRGGLRARARRR